MKIKKYIEKSFNDGKRKIIADLGEDAIILSTRTTQDKDGNSLVEIVAAVDEKDMKKMETQASTAKRPVKEKLSGLDAILNQSIPKRESENNVVNYKNTDIYGELLNLKSELSEIKEVLKYKFASALNEDFSKIYKIFIDSGLNEKTTLKLVSELSAIDPNMKFTDAIEKARKIFVGDLKINPSLQKKDKQVVSFIGSSGSGKTTTLVKLAIISKLVWDKKVLIVSSDTKKIGGAEQLETYASISTIPFRKATSPKDIKKIVSENEEYDIIFLDTIGFNPKNQKEFIEVMDFVKSAKSNRVMLVQSSSTNEKTIRDNIDRFIPIGITDVILSKVDETETLGEILSIIKEYNLPLSFVTYGQNIPDDIAPVTSKMIGQMAIIDPKNRVAFSTLFSEDF